MKRILNIVVTIGIVILPISCKDFLDVRPIDRLSDASFWHTKSDVESAIANAYGHLFDVLTHGPYIPTNGDIRAGEIINSGWWTDFEAWGHNDLTMRNYPVHTPAYNLPDLFDWYPFYQAISECNIDISRIADITELSEKEKEGYVAEATFIRDFTYFFISRLYGDVPLYTKPYDKSALPRTPMLEVLQFCLDDLDKIKDVLPWQYNEQTKWGIRASRASVYALIANINMWMAGFDKGNQRKYWQAAADAVMAIKNSGKFGLLPIDQFRKIFEGRTKESLFEFEVNANYDLATVYVTIGEWTLHDPIVDGYSSSDIFYSGVYLERIFPPQISDKRRDLWFHLPYINTSESMFLKFSNVVNWASTTAWRLNDNLTIFRYGGILLLGAEALAEMGEDAVAIELLNEVRKRAGAPLYSPSMGNLKDFIFDERQRELCGEGVRWYDLIRTGRILNPNECKNSLTQQQFDAGAWTVPIDPKARIFNTNISLNDYWTK